MSDFKRLAITNTLWKFAERICAQAISFVISIVLARLLTVEEYSAVSVVAIFFAVANIFISGGLGTALIQKKDADEQDYSSVLYLSVFVSLALYVLLFFAAPWIADLYEQQQLISIVRIMALSLPVYAVKSVYCAYISATLQFRKFFWATLGGTVVSAIVGVVMALRGFGAWALVWQQISNTLIDTILLVISTRMRILLKFSFSRLRSLFAYGWKVFVSSLLGTIYSETIPLFIGIKFTPTNLSFYTKGRSFPSFLTTTTTSTLSAVLFPILAKHQDDRGKLLQYTRRFISIASYVVFPLMLGFFAISDNFVAVVLTEKWMPASYYIKVFSVVFMFDMIHFGNCETIKAMGRSDIYLVMEIIKKASYFLIIAVFLFLGETPESLALAFVVCTIVAIIVNSIPNGKLIGYSCRQQVADIFPNLLLSVIMCVLVTAIGRISIVPWLSLLLQIICGVAIYFLLSVVTKNENYRFLLDTIRQMLKK